MAVEILYSISFSYLQILLPLVLFFKQSLRKNETRLWKKVNTLHHFVLRYSYFPHGKRRPGRPSTTFVDTLKRDAWPPQQ